MLDTLAVAFGDFPPALACCSLHSAAAAAAAQFRLLSWFSLSES
jgi:hypothetical protein